MSDERLPPAAWMRDPEDPSMYRYWNGERWTEHRSVRQTPGPRSRVFISYRDEDTTADVSAIRQALDARLGSNTVFRDSDAISMATDWKTEVGRALGESAVALVVIGPAWTCSAAVEFELHRAVANQVAILPLFVRGAGPDLFQRELAIDLRHLAQLTGAELDHRHFERDVETIASRLLELGAGGQGAGASPWWIESARRSSGPGLMGGDLQLIGDEGAALHVSVRYDSRHLGHVRVNGDPVRWRTPHGVPRRSPPRHGFRFTVFSSGRRDTMELVLEWSSRRAFRRRESPVSLALSCNGVQLAKRPG